MSLVVGLVAKVLAVELLSHGTMPFLWSHAPMGCRRVQ